MGIDTKTAEELLKHIYEDQPFPLHDAARREEVLEEFQTLSSVKTLLDRQKISNPDQKTLDAIFDMAQEQNSGRGLKLLPVSRKAKTAISFAASFLIVASIGLWVQANEAEKDAMAKEEIRQLLSESPLDQDQFGNWDDYPNELDYLHLRTSEMQKVSDSVYWDEPFLDPATIPQAGSIHQVAGN